MSSTSSSLKTFDLSQLKDTSSFSATFTGPRCSGITTAINAILAELNKSDVLKFTAPDSLYNDEACGAFLDKHSNGAVLVIDQALPFKGANFDRAVDMAVDRKLTLLISQQYPRLSTNVVQVMDYHFLFTNLSKQPATEEEEEEGDDEDEEDALEYRLHKLRELKKLYSSYGKVFPTRQQFREALNDAAGEQFGCLVIHATSPSEHLEEKAFKWQTCNP